MEAYLRSCWHRVAPGAGDAFLTGRGSTDALVALVIGLQAAGFAVTVRDVLRFPTVPALAGVLGERVGGPGEYPAFDEVWGASDSPWSSPSSVPSSTQGSVVSLEPGSTLVRLAPGSGTPLFFVHNGIGYVRFVEGAVDHFRAGRPVYGFEALGLRDRTRPPLSIPEFAERYVAELRRVQPHGPYWIGGLCLGAQIAFEMAHRLVEAGEEVAVLALLNSVRPGFRQRSPGWGLSDLYLERLAYLQLMFGDLELTANLPAVITALEQTFWIDHVRPEDFYWHAAISAATAFAQEHYDPRPYPAPALVFQPERTTSGPEADWRSVAPQARTHSFDAADSLAVMATPEFIAAVAPRVLRA